MLTVAVGCTSPSTGGSSPTPTAEPLVSDCAAILALPEVAAAVAQLAGEGEAFTLPQGSTVPDLEGIYALTQTVTFVPDAGSNGATLSGTVSLRDQQDGTIVREGLGGSLEQFAQGTEQSVAFCALAATGVEGCPQTIARIEALAVDSNGVDLAGTFLAVVVEVATGADATCAPAGDFIFGDITLTRAEDGPALTGRGKLPLPNTVLPNLLVMATDGSNGVVSDLNSPATLWFALTDPPTAQTLALPEGLAPTGVGALGLSRDNTRLAVVTDDPDAAVVFDNRSRNAVRANAATPGQYLGWQVDFADDASLLFMPTVDASSTGVISVLQATADATDDLERSLPLPAAAVPVQAKLSPDGELLAVLLQGDADPGLAAELVFTKTDQTTSGSAIDLVTQGGGTVLVGEMVFAPSGDWLYLAGLGAVLAVQTIPPHAVTRIDVSDGAEDDPMALDLSGDGEVLVVAVDDAHGSVNFAVLAAETGIVLDKQLLPGIERRGAIGVAHFDTQRVAVVANYTGQIVPVQTVTPYRVGQAVSVADLPADGTIGMVTAGGSFVAVTNIDEPAVYVFELADGAATASP